MVSLKVAKKVFWI